MTRATPEYFYRWLDGQMRFTVDVCASEENAKHPRFWSVKENGLAQSWLDETYFKNPPYGRQTPMWMARARDACMYERAMGCSLVPARVGVDWWRRYVLQLDGEAGRLKHLHQAPGLPLIWWRWERLVVGVYFHDERIEFDGLETGAPFDAAVIFMGHPSRRPVKPRVVPSLPGHRSWPLLVKDWP